MRRTRRSVVAAALAAALSGCGESEPRLSGLDAFALGNRVEEIRQHARAGEREAAGEAIWKLRTRVTSLSRAGMLPADDVRLIRRALRRVEEALGTARRRAAAAPARPNGKQGPQA